MNTNIRRFQRQYAEVLKEVCKVYNAPVKQPRHKSELLSNQRVEINEGTLSKLVYDGVLEKVSRGCYRLHMSRKNIYNLIDNLLK